jgi:hypothetical protein
VRIAEECLLFGPELAVEGRVFENNGDKKMPLFRRMSVSGRNQICTHFSERTVWIRRSWF